MIILVAVALWGCRLSVKGYDDYLGREQTGAIKGIFAIIILFSHMRDYVIPGAHSTLFTGVAKLLGQLMVVMFLFYSGYGIMEAIKRDRRQYMSTFLRHRFLRTWLMFATAVVLFMVLNFVLGREYTLCNNLLALTGWTDIGNNSWFMFVILALYLLTYVALLTSERLGVVIGMIFVLSIGLLLALRGAGKGWWWYDTILAYPTGMLVSMHKQWIADHLRGVRNWLWTMLVAVMLFSITYVVSGNGSRPDGWSMTLHVISAVLFGIVVVMFTMKLKLRNKILDRLGENAFAIYILQRLAMITCKHYGLDGEPLIFAAIVIPATLLIASIYTAAFNRLRL